MSSVGCPVRYASALQDACWALEHVTDAEVEADD
jgi:hypothetical protein